FVGIGLASTAGPVTDYDWAERVGVCRRLFRALRSIATNFVRGVARPKLNRLPPRLHPFRGAALAADFSARRAFQPSRRNGRAAFCSLRDRRWFEAPPALSDYIR